MKIILAKGSIYIYIYKSFSSIASEDFNSNKILRSKELKNKGKKLIKIE